MNRIAQAILTAGLAAALVVDARAQSPRPGPPAAMNQGLSAGQVIPVWPGVAPGSERWTQKEMEYRNEWDRKAMVRNVSKPTLTAFVPDPSVATGAAVVVCPGGGFRFHSWQSEGTEVAEWLRKHGVTAFVLKYRLMETPASDEEFRKAMTAFFAGLSGRRDRPTQGDATKARPKSAIPAEMQDIGALGAADGRQAIKVVRQHAAAWGIKPDRIGIMGFSAGGMVTMGVVTDHDAESRPDFAAPIYGPGFGSVKVPDDAPPLFILCASDDTLAASGSVRLYSEWKAAGHAAELHIYEKGGHGFGMNRKGLPVDRWIERFGDWLGQRGLARADDESGFVSLFDGKTLRGWTVKCLPRDRELARSAWSVDRGTILASTVGHKDHFYIMLVSDKEYGDFVLRLRVQIRRGVTGNSGIQIRSSYSPESGWMEGPQIDIDPPNPRGTTGKLWNEGPGEHRWLSNEGVPAAMFVFADEGDGWNDLEITAKGTRIRSVLNGVTVVDYDGAGVLDDAVHKRRGVGLRGSIGLQIHMNDELELRFKDVRIKSVY